MLNRLPDARAAALRGAWIAPDVALVVWDGAIWPGAFRPRLGRTLLGAPLLCIRLADGGERIGLLRVRRGTPATATLSIGDPPGGAPSLSLSALAEDGVGLVDTLAPAARVRLLTLLLDAGLGLFRIVPGQRFLDLVAMLARDGAADAPHAVPIATGPFGLRLLRAEGPAPSPGAISIIGSARVQRIAAAGASTVFLLAEAPAAGETVCGGGDAPWLRRIAPPEGDLPALLDVIAGGGPAAAALATLLPAAIGQRAASDPQAADLLRVASLLSPARPRSRSDATRPVTAALELALPDGEGGLFLRGWLRDPHRLVAGFSLAAGAEVRPVAAEALHRFPRRDLGERFRRAVHAPGEGAEGFVAHIAAAPRSFAQPELVIGLSGGGTMRLTPGLRTLGPAASRDAVLASVRPEHASVTVLETCLGPAASRMQRAHLAGPRTPHVIRLGRMPARPEVTVLVPLYRNLSFLRAQVAAFAADADWAKAETIFVLDNPEQAAEAEHLLRGLHIMHGLPLILVVLPRNLGYAGANNVGAGFAAGRMLLLLNSDVIPDRPGWLLKLAAAARKPGAAGPKLLFDDGSIQHAGLTFARDIDGLWYNRHYFKGMPRHHAPACVPHRVPGVTGAALMVRRALFDAVDGLTEDYVVGDYEDSDLCLKLRRAGADIVYEPAVELWHFERRSIGLHAGYTGTLASLYNRRLHAARWGEAIAALTRRFDERKGARR
ncbi:glycosyltransferase [Elioraea sp.]|uniref:glycosyltransferase n=1 Tax=Elioraea sp. TaxID=2185103 RepID=UPI0025C30C94|nr:glycosyltransferase [Elioraea sp.]